MSSRRLFCVFYTGSTLSLSLSLSLTHTHTHAQTLSHSLNNLARNNVQEGLNERGRDDEGAIVRDQLQWRKRYCVNCGREVELGNITLDYES